jgi:capsid portal protein
MVLSQIKFNNYVKVIDTESFYYGNYGYVRSLDKSSDTIAVTLDHPTPVAAYFRVDQLHLVIAADTVPCML